MSTASPLASNKADSPLIRILQRIFSFPVMLAVLLAVLAVLTVRARFDDPDMWWHLKMGEVIWTTHAIPLTDIFSFTTNHHALIPQEWLAQLAIYGAFKYGGFSGLMFCFCLVTSTLVIAGYALCSLYSRNLKVAFVGAMLIWLFGTIGFAIRPQMVGYLLLIAELLLLHLGHTRNPRWFFCLPILFALWINCHGSFILGIVVAGIFLFASFFSFQIGSLKSRHWDSACRRILILALLLSVAALFLNPVGAKQILYPFDTLLNMHIQMANVEEWAPLNMTGERGIALMAVLLCSFLLVAVRRSDLFFDELMLLAMGTWLAASHVRLLIVFGILAAPILSRQLSTSWEGYDQKKDRIWPNAVMIGTSLVVLFLAFPSNANLERQVESQNPVRAVQFIKTSHLSGPMLNEYGFGGYLIWAAPEHPVFVDGRGDVFEWSGVLDEFNGWEELQSDPNALLQKYGISFCLLSRQSPMARLLPLLHEWKIAYSDNNAVVLVRAASGNPAEQ